MPYEMYMSESFDTGGAFLQEPGTYYMAVINVAALIEQHGHEEVWFASVEVIGCPPTWGLGMESLIAFSKFLESRKRK